MTTWQRMNQPQSNSPKSEREGGERRTDEDIRTLHSYGKQLQDQIIRANSHFCYSLIILRFPQSTTEQCNVLVFGLCRLEGHRVESIRTILNALRAHKQRRAGVNPNGTNSISRPLSEFSDAWSYCQSADHSLGLSSSTHSKARSLRHSRYGRSCQTECMRQS